MSGAPAKRIAVIVRASAPERVAEALRGAVGLSLRGDEVHVVLMDAAQAADGNDTRIRRALATLDTLGHTLARGDRAAAAAVHDADAVEVWS